MFIILKMFVFLLLFTLRLVLAQNVIKKSLKKMVLSDVKNVKGLFPISNTDLFSLYVFYLFKLCLLFSNIFERPLILEFCFLYVVLGISDKIFKHFLVNYLFQESFVFTVVTLKILLF